MEDPVEKRNVKKEPEGEWHPFTEDDDEDDNSPTEIEPPVSPITISDEEDDENIVHDLSSEEDDNNEEPPSNELRRSKRTTAGKPPKRFGDIGNLISSINAEPSDWDEVQQLPHKQRELWKKAAEQEMKLLHKNRVWDLVDLPPNRKPITCRWVFKTKLDGDGRPHTYKARLVARGFSQKYGEDYDETYAPVVRYDTIRVLLAISAMKKKYIRQLDVQSAYLNGVLEEELFMEQPPGFVSKGQEDKVCRLRKSLYGLKQSALTWNRHVTEILAKLKFKRSVADPCLYTRTEKNGSITYILLYVDDLLVVGESESSTMEIKKQLDNYFEVRDLGEATYYLGIKIERNQKGDISLSQETKIKQMIQLHGLTEAKPVKTPMETGFLSGDTTDSPLLSNSHQYKQVIGSLLYLATVSRPDIATAVGFLARRVSAPTQMDWNAAKRVIRYLAGTKHYKLCLFSDSNGILQCFVDADWAGDKKDRKSTSGYLFQLGSSTIAWNSHKQTCVSMSSTEAEYVAASHAAKELQWLRQLLTDMKIPPKDATPLFEDNQGCIKMVKSDKCGARTKHIDVCYHQLRHLREQGIIDIQYCPSERMTADVLTKPLPQVQFNKMLEAIGFKT